MFDRRKLALGAASLPFALALPKVAMAQSDAPDFEIVGSVQTDPAGYEIAWGDGWNNVDITDFTFDPVPGERGFVVLDSDERELGESIRYMASQRLVFETTATSGAVDPEELINSFDESHPSTHMGFAPGTVIESRHVTDRGCWFSFGPGPDGGGIEGTIGLSLYYTPTADNSTMMNLWFSVGHWSFRTEEFFEEMDSTVSINGNWLLGLDDLENYWEAVQNSRGWYDD